MILGKEIVQHSTFVIHNLQPSINTHSHCIPNHSIPQPSSQQTAMRGSGCRNFAKEIRIYHNRKAHSNTRRNFLPKNNLVPHRNGYRSKIFENCHHSHRQITQPTSKSIRPIFSHNGMTNPYWPVININTKKMLRGNHFLAIFHLKF